MQNDEGRLLTVDASAATPPTIFQGGMLFDSTGRLVTTELNPIHAFRGGLGFDVDGALCVTSI